MEEYAYVLDYLPQGTGVSKFDKKEPVVYALGDNEFKLFELVAKTGAVINIGDRVYIGKDATKRTAIDHVKRRIGYDDLSNMASSELEYSVEAIVKANETRFIRFYNEAGPVTIKKHLLEELPGLGKKTMMAILEERDKNGPFKGYEDLVTRVPAVKSPEKLIVARIVLEITDPSRKRYLFVLR